MPDDYPIITIPSFEGDLATFKRGFRVRHDRLGFESEPWKARIEYVGGFMPFNLHIMHGVMRYGPDGSPFACFTYKGAKRKAERILRKQRRIQALKLGYNEVQLSEQEEWERKFNA